ncbi:hypothetical protein [Bacillus sp. OAE603]|uniref:hypothetical protein n=1 Tax=Gottfriedia sp. OAE603 TaxID=2663872 RepID=UPI00178AC62B
MLNCYDENVLVETCLCGCNKIIETEYFIITRSRDTKELVLNVADISSNFITFDEIIIKILPIQLLKWRSTIELIKSSYPFSEPNTVERNVLRNELINLILDKE